MRLQWLISAVALFSGCFSGAVTATATFPLVPFDEPATQVSSPSATIPAFQYGSGPAVFVTTTPLLCANTAAPIALTQFSTPYYSSYAIASGGQSPQPFVFGASAGSPATSAIASGLSQLSYGGSSPYFEIAGDGTLVCYGLDANGVHKATRDLFADSFDSPGTDGLVGNSTVTLSVFHLPATASDYYGYTLDVTIPPLPNGTTCGASALDCNFSLVEGYDTSVFGTGTGQWCLAPAGAQSCVSPPPAGGTAASFGDININYSNYGTTASLAAPIAPAAARTYHFVAFRYFKTGVSAIPATGAPVVVAALFSPLDLEEGKLDDNVAVGTNALANQAPGVVQDGIWTSFANDLSLLQENTDSGTLTFGISDPDTVEPVGGPNLSATVMLNLPAGLQIPVTTSCLLTSVPGAIPVTRQCTLDIPLNDAAWWNAVVPTAYQNQFNALATDVTNGVYASGVTASAQIVVTDSVGKSSAPVSVPVHILSTKNDPPVVIVGAVLPGVADLFADSALIPTYSCSIAANSCGTRGFVDLTGAFAATPGPGAAFDELASQTTAVSPYAGDDANGGNVKCVVESGIVFLADGNPLVQASAAANTYDMSFFLDNPLAVGSSLCTLTIKDNKVGSGSEGPATATVQFRVLVNL